MEKIGTMWSVINAGHVADLRLYLSIKQSRNGTGGLTMANERLIDANALWEKADALERATAKESGWQEMCDGISQVKELISEAPTVDAVPVVHGRWIAQDSGRTRFMCSKCKSKNHHGHEKYCPNCGARMDGGKDDE
jgi:hypothetical protein